MMTEVKSEEAVLRIYHASEPSDAVLNLAQIARCLGVQAELIDLRFSSSPAEELRAPLSSGNGAAFWDIRSLSEVLSLADWRSVAPDLASSAVHVLILATSEGESQSEVLKILSRGAVTKIRSAGRPELVSFPAEPHRLSAELSGHQYARFCGDAIALEISAESGSETVMQFGERSVAFVSIAPSLSHVFIWSTLSVFDVDQPLEKEIEFEQALDEYIPAIIFLRRGFGERCWHSPRVGADIVIDDPVLTERYGFIAFADLLGLAKKLNFHVTVAFIPWNHWRTRKKSLRVFLDHPESFGICAHGCDHTRNEFRTSDYDDLLRRSHLAAERLDRHRERTGMNWERMVVCPREDYSLEALQAFADSGRFLGLVNTGCIPRDLESPHVRGSDLLLPAQDAFSGFPLFKRHYWSDFSVFAMAAFLGKPVILVEHHAFFKDQHQVLKDFVTQLGATCPTVRWSGLTDVACTTFQWRRVAPETLEVRFFTDDLLMNNPDAEPRMFCFRRRFPANAVVESVAVNGTQVPFAREEEFICFEARLPGKAAASVQIRRPATMARHAPSRGWTYGAQVATRRFLSEMRDNWLPGNETVLRWANRLMQVLRLRA